MFVILILSLIHATLIYLLRRFDIWNYLTLGDEDEPLLNAYACGWMEDGRLGHPPDVDQWGFGSYIESNPSPLTQLRPPARPKKVAPAVTKKGALALVEDQPKPIEVVLPTQFVCQQASAGSRHSLWLMVDCRVKPAMDVSVAKKVYLTGLNQQGLCEEPGHTAPFEIQLHGDEEPISVFAGYGTSFIITKFGNVYSWGNGRYGVLGHGDEESFQIPRQISGLNRQQVRKISAGMYHASALCNSNIGNHVGIYTWGRNNKGQLGLELPEDAVVLTPTKITFFRDNMTPTDVSCGCEHTIALIDVEILDDEAEKEKESAKLKGQKAVKGANNAEQSSPDVRTVLYGWGDDSKVWL